MADYKRMVSYMYQYEDGVKRKNIGYARIEARGGQCKITLHMQLLGQPDSIFPTYLIQRKAGDVELIYLGDAVLKGHLIDTRFIMDRNNIMGSGYGLSDIGGILLFLNERIFFGTEWDDKPIVAREVMEALKPKEDKTEVIQRDESPPELKHEVSDLYAYIEASQIQEEKGREILRSAHEEDCIPKYKMPRGWKTVERLGISQASQLEKYPKDPLGNILLSKDEDSSIKNIQENPESKKVAKSELLMEEEVLKEGKVEEEERTIDVDNTHGKIEAEEESHQEEKETLSQEEREQVLEKAMEQEVGAFKQSGDRIEGEKKRDEEDASQEHPIALKFFNHYPRMYPFEDNQVTICVKIEPKDIGYLPSQLWGLSNNSFLLHGFYSYRHLIFAKMQDQYGSRYILGVPGVYHNRERFMAKMFGFDHFKSIRKRELKPGDFGYWYVVIKL